MAKSIASPFATEVTFRATVCTAREVGGGSRRLGYAVSLGSGCNLVELARSARVEIPWFDIVIKPLTRPDQNIVLLEMIQDVIDDFLEGQSFLLPDLFADDGHVSALRHHGGAVRALDRFLVIETFSKRIYYHRARELFALGPLMIVEGKVLQRRLKTIAEFSNNCSKRVLPLR